MDILGKIGTFLQGKKTYLVVLISLLTALLGYLNGALDLTQLIAAVLAAFGLGATRSAIEKSGK